jgi:hypothetical protein
MPIFYTECFWFDSGNKVKDVIFFPFGSKVGTLVESDINESKNKVTYWNYATLALTGSQASIRDLTQGGLGVIAIQNKIARSLMRTPFVMLYPSELDKLITSIPKTQCDYSLD